MVTHSAFNSDARRVTNGQMAMTSTPAAHQNGHLQVDTSVSNGPPSPQSPVDSVSISSGSGKSKNEPDFGKFYQTSYLEMEKGDNYIKRGPSPTQNKSPTSQNFHRPDNFSYKFTPQYGKTKKQTGMIGALVSNIQRKQIREASKASRGAVLKNEEPLKMSTFASGHKPKPNELSAIERDDWPAPPSPAAILPERLRERRRSRGEPEEEDDEDIKVPVDPQLKREMDEMSKIKDSPMAKVILDDLAVKAEEVKTRTLDPRSASRTPAANKEPHLATRYDNPVFASPSRNLDRLRLHSVDDLLAEEHKKREVVTLPRYTAPKEYHGMTAMVIKPGYTMGKATTRSKSSTLPANGDGSFLNGDHMVSNDDIDDDTPGRKSYSDLDRLERKWHTLQLSNTLEPSVFERRPSAISDGPPFLATEAFDRRRRSPYSSMREHKEPDQPVPYENIKCTDGVCPKGYDKNSLEKYLSNEEFEQVLNVKRDEFYRMPEWKRNDLKRKHELF